MGLRKREKERERRKLKLYYCPNLLLFTKSDIFDLFRIFEINECSKTIF